ncbi:MAG: hypothetical protein SGILL_002014 [Bacillariaceae sp.]
MPPSSAEEINRQHHEATMLIEQPMSAAPHNPKGEISTNDKTCPTWPADAPEAVSSDKKNKPQSDRMEDEKKEWSVNEAMQESNDCNASTASIEQQLKELEQIVRQRLENPDCWSTRGQVDVSKLQRKVQEGYNGNYRNNKENLPSPLSPTNYWDPRNAAKRNVTLTRPSHDGWGIGKIVLRFSDDFLTKVYQFPWWKEFDDALKPIMQVLQDTTSQQLGSSKEIVVVRALLASLPPGVTIPIHNDSGEWVKTTHRVHVPILVKDPQRILFRVGMAPHLLERIDCTPGHVFEINNQAKHAVSNCDTDHRVHLIIDYVVIDKETASAEELRRLKPIPLQPGEKLFQTRRSIDRLKDMAARPTPSYIILGAQKAGTTSLYDYINQHPWVIKARRRETHCLDWRWNTDLKTKKGKRNWCQKFFFTEDLKKRPSCLTGDSTPSYLLDSRRVIPRLKTVFDWKMMFFVMMRDPVKRAASHFAMVTSTEGTPAQLETRGNEWREKTLWQVIQQELSKMKECGLIPYWNIETGTADQPIFHRFSGSDQEAEAWNLYLDKHVPLNTGSYGLLARGMYAVQLRPWLRAFAQDQFLCLRLESMKADGVQPMMKHVWKHLDLPNHPVCDVSAKNTREYQAMDPEIESYLQRFFQPHNRSLESVLESSSDVWRDPWPYGI